MSDPKLPVPMAVSPDSEPTAAQDIAVPDAADSMPQSPESFLSSRDAAEAPKLSPKQVAALKSLTNGNSIQDAAFNAHVNRTTVWRWLTEHAAFRAAYHRWKAASELSAQSRLIALQDVAVDVMTEELEEKRNGRLAALILSKMGMLTPTPTGPTEERRAVKEIETEKRRRDIDLARAAGDLDSMYFPSRHLIEDAPPAASLPAGDAAAGDATAGG